MDLHRILTEGCASVHGGTEIQESTSSSAYNLVYLCDTIWRAAGLACTIYCQPACIMLHIDLWVSTGMSFCFARAAIELRC